LQAIQDELDQPESGLDSGELAQLIAVVRDLVSALKGQAGETVSGGMKERVGLALQPLLKSVVVNLTLKINGRRPDLALRRQVNLRADFGSAFEYEAIFTF
jgi:hypothetical protein